MPLVSIGVPVYNEGKWLRGALDSLLAQEFRDFELIISDNASTDETHDICMEYVSRDPRVRYYRNEKNLGGARNFNRVFELSQGEYFMVSAADDRRHPAFLSRCVEVLNRHPSVVLVYSQTVLIDDKGDCHGFMPGSLDTRGYDALSRYHLVMWGYIYGNHVYGLIRADALKKTRLFLNTFGNDRVLLLELSLLGEFAYIPEALFYRNRIRQGNNKYLRDKRWLIGLDPSNQKRISFPGICLFKEYLKTAVGAPLPARKRLLLVVSVVTGFLGMFGRGWVRPFFMK